MKDGEVLKLIDRIGEHYHNNINNRYVRQALLNTSIDRQTWERVENLAGVSEYARLNGYQYSELYDMVIGAARFVSRIRKEVVPNLRTSLTGGADRDVLRDMVINNYEANLGIYADMINEVYLKAVSLDRDENPPGRCVFDKTPELKEIGKLLISG